MTALNKSTLIVIPTFNERENLPGVITCLRAAESNVDVLVVGDSLSDGTGGLADETAAVDRADNNGEEHIYVLRREGKGGLWGMYRASFAQDLERDYEVLCEMDADGSHAPEQFHLLLEKLKDGADVVIGSRYIPGGKTINWPMSRRVLSRGGNLYISLAFGADISDITANYCIYRREVLETLGLESIDKTAYLFQTRLALKTIQADFLVEKVPVASTEHEYSESKMGGSFVKQSLLQVAKRGFGHRSQQVKNLGSEIGRLAGHKIKQRFRK